MMMMIESRAKAAAAAAYHHEDDDGSAFQLDEIDHHADEIKIAIETMELFHRLLYISSATTQRVISRFDTRFSLIHLSLSFFSYTLSTFTFYLCARAPALNWRMIEWFIPVREFCHFPRLLLLLPQSSFAWGHLAGYTPRYMCDVIATCYYQPFPPVGFNRCITQTQRKILASLKASARVVGFASFASVI